MRNEAIPAVLWVGLGYGDVPWVVGRVDSCAYVDNCAFCRLLSKQTEPLF